MNLASCLLSAVFSVLILTFLNLVASEKSYSTTKNQLRKTKEQEFYSCNSNENFSSYEICDTEKSRKKSLTSTKRTNVANQKKTESDFVIWEESEKTEEFLDVEKTITCQLASKDFCVEAFLQKFAFYYSSLENTRDASAKLENAQAFLADEKKSLQEMYALRGDALSNYLHLIYTFKCEAKAIQDSQSQNKSFDVTTQIQELQKQLKESELIAIQIKNNIAYLEQIISETPVIGWLSEFDTFSTGQVNYLNPLVGKKSMIRSFIRSFIRYYPQAKSVEFWVKGFELFYGRQAYFASEKYQSPSSQSKIGTFDISSFKLALYKKILGIISEMIFKTQSFDEACDSYQENGDFSSEEEKTLLTLQLKNLLKLQTLFSITKMNDAEIEKKSASLKESVFDSDFQQQEKMLSEPNSSKIERNFASSIKYFLEKAQKSNEANEQYSSTTAENESSNERSSAAAPAAADNLQSVDAALKEFRRQDGEKSFIGLLKKYATLPADKNNAKQLLEEWGVESEESIKKAFGEIAYIPFTEEHANKAWKTFLDGLISANTFDKNLETKFCEMLWKTGIPAELRSVLWPAMLSIRQTNIEVPETMALDQSENVKQIVLDVNRTKPSVFYTCKEISKAYIKLMRILNAASAPEIGGYPQGMNGIAALLSDYLSESDAAKCTYEIYRSLSMNINFKFETRIFDANTMLLEKFLPTYHGLLDEWSMLDTFVSSWYLSAFGLFKNSVRARIFDLYFYFGMKVFPAISMALLRTVQDIGQIQNLEYPKEAKGLPVYLNIPENEEKFFYYVQMYFFAANATENEVNQFVKKCVKNEKP